MIVAPVSKYPGVYEILDHAADRPEGEFLYIRLSTAEEETTIRVACSDQSETWNAFRIEAQFDFNAVGVLKAYLEPLAESGIPIMAFSSFRTDHILVKAGDCDRAVSAWKRKDIAVIEC